MCYSLPKLIQKSEVTLPSQANVIWSMLWARPPHTPLLEPVCCKKQQKKVPDQLLVCRIGELWSTWKSRINFIPFRIFRGPLFYKPVTGQELFFAVSYSKPVLACLSKLRLGSTFYLLSLSFNSILTSNYYIHSICMPEQPC